MNMKTVTFEVCKVETLLEIMRQFDNVRTKHKIGEYDCWQVSLEVEADPTQETPVVDVGQGQETPIQPGETRFMVGGTKKTWMKVYGKYQDISCVPQEWVKGLQNEQRKSAEYRSKWQRAVKKIEALREELAKCREDSGRYLAEMETEVTRRDKEIEELRFANSRLMALIESTQD